MQKLSPLQRVRKEHGSKAELAEKLFDKFEILDSQDPDEVEQNIHTASNRKLLRLWDAYQTLESDYGSRDDLIDAIVDARFPKGNADYRAKLSRYTVPHLLDLARQYT